MCDSIYGAVVNAAVYRPRCSRPPNLPRAMKSFAFCQWKKNAVEGELGGDSRNCRGPVKGRYPPGRWSGEKAQCQQTKTNQFKLDDPRWVDLSRFPSVWGQSVENFWHQLLTFAVH